MYVLCSIVNWKQISYITLLHLHPTIDWSTCTDQTKEEAEDSGVCMQLIYRKENNGCVRKIRYYSKVYQCDKSYELFLNQVNGILFSYLYHCYGGGNLFGGC